LICSDGCTNVHASSSFSAELLDELEQLLMGIALMKELTVRTKDYLVSFGERLSTRLFAAYLNSIGNYARQVCKLVWMF
jgi:aspartate kinase